MAVGEISIRTLHLGEGAMFRELRLRAVQDSPDSFRESLEETRAQPDEHWDQLVDGVARHDDAALFVAEIGVRTVGVVFVRVDEYRVTHVGGMWVDRETRRTGVGERLLTQALDFGNGRGSSKAHLWAPADNEAAQALYRSAGFTPTGESMLLREGSHIEVIGMEAHI